MMSKERSRETVEIYFVNMHLYLIAMLLAGWACAVQGRCPSGFWRWGSSCYKFGRSKITFHQSVFYCETQSFSRPVMFETMAEIRAIKNHMRGLIHGDYWIGLTDERQEGVWRWHGCDADGQITRVTDWYRGEPNNAGGNEHCVTLSSNIDYTWNDIPCSFKAYPICELHRKVKG